MIISRVVSLLLRFGEFVSGAASLSSPANFGHGGSPHGREIYTEIIAALAVVLSLVWMIPTFHQFLHYPADFIMSLAWFASFAALVNWVHRANCGGAFHWGGITHGGYCGQWKADEAFAFISACFWLASSILGAYVYHKRIREDRVGRRSNV
ncbi:integral membrane protein [Saccharata proteae CBS 121410]|uniref:Integral membrane protein n=1 Tax=Saccharata proteae CBS 121410 TaxID=1314787 RepID=A0A9P4HRR6_9PEZI|nr:integral membrane protein [Saccharata proteae CBS 121410]